MLTNRKFQAEFITNKKFRTAYRPFMIKLKAEVCEALSQRTHPVKILIGNLTDSVHGNLLNPCPITVSLKIVQ